LASHRILVIIAAFIHETGPCRLLDSSVLTVDLQPRDPTGLMLLLV